MASRTSYCNSRIDKEHVMAIRQLRKDNQRGQRRGQKGPGVCRNKLWKVALTSLPLLPGIQPEFFVQHSATEIFPCCIKTAIRAQWDQNRYLAELSPLVWLDHSDRHLICDVSLIIPACCGERTSCLDCLSYRSAFPS